MDVRVHGGIDVYNQVLSSLSPDVASKLIYDLRRDDFFEGCVPATDEDIAKVVKSIELARSLGELNLTKDQEYDVYLVKRPDCSLTDIKFSQKRLDTAFGATILAKVTSLDLAGSQLIALEYYNRLQREHNLCKVLLDVAGLRRYSSSSDRVSLICNSFSLATINSSPDEHIMAIKDSMDFKIHVPGPLNRDMQFSDFSEAFWPLFLAHQEEIDMDASLSEFLWLMGSETTKAFGPN